MFFRLRILDNSTEQPKLPGTMVLMKSSHQQNILLYFNVIGCHFLRPRCLSLYGNATEKLIIDHLETRFERILYLSLLQNVVDRTDD